MKGAAGLILAQMAGGLSWVTPAAAVAAGARPRMLTATEAAWLGGLGEAIAPPSRAGGLVPYVDHHLTVPYGESLLALRYLEIEPPYVGFYRSALGSLARGFGEAPPPSGDARWADMLKALGEGSVEGWQGPPPPLFLFAIRLDAIDIAYGTRAAFARLGVDYLPHVEPETDW